MKSPRCCKKKEIIVRKRKPVKTPPELIKLLMFQHLIIYVKADNQYIIVITTQKMYKSIRFSMADIKPLLDPGQFFFGHRSYYINTNHIDRYGNRSNGIRVLMANTDDVFVCPNMKIEFLERVKGIKSITRYGEKIPDNDKAGKV